MFQRNVLISHLARIVDCFLQNGIRFTGQIRFTTGHFRIGFYLTIQHHVQILDIHAQFLKEEVGHAFARHNDSLKQMHRLDHLLVILLNQLNGLLNSLL